MHRGSTLLRCSTNIATGLLASPGTSTSKGKYMFEGFFGYLIGGAVIGVIARLLKPGAEAMGWIMTIVLGIVGAVIGGWAATTFGLHGFMTWVVAIVAAIALLFAYEALRKKRPA